MTDIPVSRKNLRRCPKCGHIAGSWHFEISESLDQILLAAQLYAEIHPEYQPKRKRKPK
jgi:hypothetical protein